MLRYLLKTFNFSTLKVISTTIVLNILYSSLTSSNIINDTIFLFFSERNFTTVHYYRYTTLISVCKLVFIYILVCIVITLIKEILAIIREIRKSNKVKLVLFKNFKYLLLILFLVSIFQGFAIYNVYNNELYHIYANRCAHSPSRDYDYGEVSDLRDAIKIPDDICELLIGDSFHTLPDDVYKFKNLVSLSIYDKNIKHIDSEKFKNFKNLVSVKFREVSLDNIPTMPDSVKNLDISGGTINNINLKSIQNISNLYLYNISNNINFISDNTTQVKWKYLSVIGSESVLTNNVLLQAISKFKLEELHLICNQNLEGYKLDIPTLKILDSDTIGIKFINLNNLENLNSLNIVDLNDPQLLSEVTNIKSLTQLTINNSKLEKLPDSISNLTLLTKLDLSHNSLTTLPASLNKLYNLTELNLSDNKLNEKGIDIFTKEDKIKILDLSNNNLGFIPFSLGNLSTLENLDLSSNIQTSIPSNVLSLLINLKSLNLSSNMISYISKGDIEILHNIKDLDLNLYKNHFKNLIIPTNFKILNDSLKSLVICSENWSDSSGEGLDYSSIIPNVKVYSDYCK